MYTVRENQYSIYSMKEKTIVITVYILLLFIYLFILYT